MLFEVDRGGPGEVKVRLARAVEAFCERHGMVLPAAVVVARAEVERARAAVKALGLGLEVVGSGGCLVGEVWLGLGE